MQTVYFKYNRKYYTESYNQICVIQFDHQLKNPVVTIPR